MSNRSTDIFIYGRHFFDFLQAICDQVVQYASLEKTQRLSVDAIKNWGLLFTGVILILGYIGLSNLQSYDAPDIILRNILVFGILLIIIHSVIFTIKMEKQKQKPTQSSYSIGAPGYFKRLIKIAFAIFLSVIALIPVLFILELAGII